MSLALIISVLMIVVALVTFVRVRVLWIQDTMYWAIQFT